MKKDLIILFLKGMAGIVIAIITGMVIGIIIKAFERYLI